MRLEECVCSFMLPEPPPIMLCDERQRGGQSLEHTREDPAA